MPRGAKGYQGVPRGRSKTRGDHGVPKEAKPHKGGVCLEHLSPLRPRPEGTKGYQGVGPRPEGTMGYQRGQDARGEICLEHLSLLRPRPEGTKGYQRRPSRTKEGSVWSTSPLYVQDPRLPRGRSKTRGDHGVPKEAKPHRGGLSGAPLPFTSKTRGHQGVPRGRSKTRGGHGVPKGVKPHREGRSVWSKTRGDQGVPKGAKPRTGGVCLEHLPRRSNG